MIGLDRQDVSVKRLCVRKPSVLVMTDSDGENRGGFGRLGSDERFLTVLRAGSSLLPVQGIAPFVKIAYQEISPEAYLGIADERRPRRILRGRSTAPVLASTNGPRYRSAGLRPKMAS